MSEIRRIKTALISVYYKENLDSVVKKLDELNIKILSTGGTKAFIEDLGIPVMSVEDITSYPSILGGRVKTLHPKIFGGILARRDEESDIEQLGTYGITDIDLVIVDLYPFEETVKTALNEHEIIEKIDIGGISLIRAGAKNFRDILVISSRHQYKGLLDLLNAKNGETDIEDRREFASIAFDISSHYDTAIFNFFDKGRFKALKQSYSPSVKLRYGENPHQEGYFFEILMKCLIRYTVKSYLNNLLDIDAAVNLISEFDDTTFAISNIIMHVASHQDLFWLMHGMLHLMVILFLPLEVF